MVLLLHLSNIKSADVEFSGKLYGHYTHFSYISHKDVLLLKTLQHLPLLEDDGSLESCIILIPFLSVQSSISNYISNHIILGGGEFIYWWIMAYCFTSIVIIFIQFLTMIPVDTIIFKSGLVIKALSYVNYVIFLPLIAISLIFDLRCVFCIIKLYIIYIIT